MTRTLCRCCTVALARPSGWSCCRCAMPRREHYSFPLCFTPEPQGMDGLIVFIDSCAPSDIQCDWKQNYKPALTSALVSDILHTTNQLNPLARTHAQQLVEELQYNPALIRSACMLMLRLNMCVACRFILLHMRMTRSPEHVCARCAAGVAVAPQPTERPPRCAPRQQPLFRFVSPEAGRHYGSAGGRAQARGVHRACSPAAAACEIRRGEFF